MPKIVMTPLRWAVAGLVVLGAVWALWWAILIRPGENADAAIAAKGDSAFAESRTESAKDATTAIVEKGKADTASEDLTRKNRDEILAQPGASVLVSPDVAAAGRRAICLRDAARCRPECVRLLGPCPRRAN